MLRECKHGREDFMLCEKCEIEPAVSNSAFSGLLDALANKWAGKGNYFREEAKELASATKYREAARYDDQAEIYLVCARELKKKLGI